MENVAHFIEEYGHGGITASSIDVAPGNKNENELMKILSSQVHFLFYSIEGNFYGKICYV